METPTPQPKPRSFRKATGRPTKLTQGTADLIVNFIRIGSYVETAAAAAGISKETFYQWLRQGGELRHALERAKAKGEPAPRMDAHARRLLAFPDAIEKAQAESEVHDLSTIKQASATNWQAAAWRLERKMPEKWGRRDFVRQEVSGPGGEPVKTEVVTIPGGPERVAHAYREKIRRELIAEMEAKQNVTR